MTILTSLTLGPSTMSKLKKLRVHLRCIFLTLSDIFNTVENLPITCFSHKWQRRTTLYQNHHRVNRCRKHENKPNSLTKVTCVPASIQPSGPPHIFAPRYRINRVDNPGEGVNMSIRTTQKYYPAQIFGKLLSNQQGTKWGQSVRVMTSSRYIK